MLEFEGVYRNSEVYLNGEKLSYRPYGYIGFYPLAILLLIYCLIKHIESAGILSLIVVYSTAVYYFRYRTTKDVMSLIIVICGIIGTVGCLMGFVVKTW